MFRILVADDEALIRQGIQCLLDYEALGFCFCGEASNGEQALSQILRLQPDVVLMDIRMPGLSGLEVLRAAREAGFRGKVLIISGFSDFAYAQEAIRWGVDGYLTKPVDEDELESLLCSFREDLEQQTASAPYHQYARSALLRDLLTGTPLPDHWNPAALYLDADCYQVVIWQQFGSSLQSAAECLSLTGCPRSWDELEISGSQVLLLKGQAPIRHLDALIRRSSQPVPELEGLFLACGGMADDLSQCARSFRQAQELMRRQFFCPQGRHILDCSFLIPSCRTDEAPDAALVERFTAGILDCLRTFNRRLLMQTLQQLQDRLTESGCSPESAKLLLTDLYLQVKERMQHLYPDCAIPFYSNTVIIQAMDQASFLHEVILFMAGRFEMVMNAIGTSNRDSVLEDVLHYIRHNYAENLTLESIAPLFGYNRSYLGQIFTRKTGMSFSSYVDQIRIQKARELLLSSDAKVYTIAQQVGYSNVDYFHVKFKKIVKMSPAEFRKEHAGQQV